MRTKLDPFTKAYIEAALWSSVAEGSPDQDADDPADENGQRRGTFDRSFQDCNYDEDDLSPALLAHVLEDCEAFQRDNAELLAQAYASGIYPHGREWTGPEYAGHDFWLTRNGHGAGFWDRGLGEVGNKLTQAAKVYGSEDWYVSFVHDARYPDDYGTIVAY